jgi:hypothetical protein
VGYVEEKSKINQDISRQIRKYQETKNVERQGQIRTFKDISRRICNQEGHFKTNKEI